MLPCFGKGGNNIFAGGTHCYAHGIFIVAVYNRISIHTAYFVKVYININAHIALKVSRNSKACQRAVHKQRRIAV